MPAARESFLSFHGKCPLDSICKLLLRRWVTNVRRSLTQYLSTKYGRGWLSREPEWKSGSRLMFWRWPEGQQRVARDGYQQFIVAKLPTYKCPQPKERDVTIRTQVKDKLEAVRRKKYIDKGHVNSLTSYFRVPKGDRDIRMVYDATRSRLNECLWAHPMQLYQMMIQTYLGMSRRT
jgi:hypothetical protein